MSCSTNCLYYSNKINIYTSDNFIKLPDYKLPPPSSCIYISPIYVFPSTMPNCPPPYVNIPQPLNVSGTYCGNIIAPNPSSCPTITNYQTINSYGTTQYCSRCQ